ncbi:GNAT family N-acetyltransferase [Halomonas sp. THAF12]|uniref:GNAT family N-acetyltransferase n=1 Tax=Halomonas sp. B23F22_10 TaxID=3459515 RepID=UPI00373E20DD
MTVFLRPVVSRDLADLYRLEQVAFSGDRFSRRQLWHLLNRANALTLVAEGEDGRLIGYGTLLFRYGSGRARLYSFCVHPEARGSGLGRRMLEWLEAAARERSCDWLVLEVRADNQAALALYRRMGFAPSDWLDDYYEDGCAAWRMGKALALARAG